MVKLFTKNSNLCDHNSPTLQIDRRTDGQTDDMRSQYRALRYSASRGKNCRRHMAYATPTFGENYLCARSAFPIQSCIPNLKSLVQVVFEIALIAYWGNEFDLTGPRDVVGHVTIR